MTDPSAPTVINLNTSPQQPGLVPTFSQPGTGQLQVRQTLDMASTRKDVEDITVVRIQGMIRAQIGNLRKQLEESRKAHTALVNTHNSTLENWTRTQYTADNTRISTLESALRPFTGKALTASFSTATYNSRTRNLSGTVGLSSMDFSYTVEYQEAAPQTFIDNHQAIIDSERGIKDLEANILSTKNALNNPDHIRLQASAAIAQNHLKSVEGGEELLKAINDASSTQNVEDLIRQLQA